MAHPHSHFHVTRWWSQQPEVEGYWGPSTSSIDWCESNYAVSRYIAEFANTLSNLVFIGLATYGMYHTCRQRLAYPLFLCQAAVALVGLGSFAFHATLKYEWQLGDELPMIFCSCLIAYVAFDVQPVSSHPSPNPVLNKPQKLTQSFFMRSLAWIMCLYSLSVTLVYLKYPNPIFHQVAFGFIQLLATARVSITLRNMPTTTIQEARNRAHSFKCTTVGTLLFLIGFILWNLDNFFCDQISKFKLWVGSPLSFLVEGHAWWHLLTGVGSYLIVVGIQLLSCSLKDGSDGYELKYRSTKTNRLILPYVTRIPIHHKTLIPSSPNSPNSSIPPFARNNSSPSHTLVQKRTA